MTMERASIEMLSENQLVNEQSVEVRLQLGPEGSAEDHGEA